MKLNTIQYLFGQFIGSSIATRVTPKKTPFVEVTPKKTPSVVVTLTLTPSDQVINTEVIVAIISALAAIVAAFLGHLAAIKK